MLKLIIDKANSALHGFLSKKFCSLSTGSIIDYAATVWSRYTQCNVHSVKMIQRKVARLVFNDFARLSSVTTMLELLRWDSLRKRCNQLTLMMLFKIINNLVMIPHSHILVDSPPFSYQKYH